MRYSSGSPTGSEYEYIHGVVTAKDAQGKQISRRGLTCTYTPTEPNEN